jgi:hypothetical protein
MNVYLRRKYIYYKMIMHTEVFLTYADLPKGKLYIRDIAIDANK